MDKEQVLELFREKIKELTTDISALGKRIDNFKDSINLCNENIRKFHNRIRKLEQSYPKKEVIK